MLECKGPRQLTQLAILKVLEKLWFGPLKKSRPRPHMFKMTVVKKPLPRSHWVGEKTFLSPATSAEGSLGLCGGCIKTLVTRQTVSWRNISG